MVDNVSTVLNTDSGLSTARFNDNESHTVWITFELKKKRKTNKQDTFLIMLVTNTRRTYAISVSWNGNVHRNRQFKWIRTKVMIDKDKLANSIVLNWREALRFNLQWDKFNCLPATHRWLIYRKIGRGFAFYTSFHCWRACMRMSIHRISMYLKRSTFCVHSMKSMCNTEKYCLQSSITVPMPRQFPWCFMAKVFFAPMLLYTIPSG